ncbi:YggT family protein [bacterium]|nr:YggT family protein [bacterium]
MIQDSSILASLVEIGFNVVYFALLARVILSWVPHDPFHPVVNLISQITDPVLRPFQKWIPPLAGFDLSPVFAYFALEVAHSIIVGLLF